MGELTHFNEQGRARMVDVTEKAVTHRRAVAAGEIRVSPETMVHIKNGTLKKGDVLAVAQVAGIQAAKHNWELVPMCHPLPLTGIDITFHLSDEPCMVEIQAAVTCTGVTGDIAFDDIGDAIRDIAYIKVADTANNAWALETM